MGGGAKSDKKLGFYYSSLFYGNSEEEIRLLHLEKQILTGLGEICRFFCRFAFLQHLHTNKKKKNCGGNKYGSWNVISPLTRNCSKSAGCSNWQLV
jgi:hypothetical protein